MLDSPGQAKESTVAVPHRGCLGTKGLQLPSLRRMGHCCTLSPAKLAGSFQHVCDMTPGFGVRFVAAGWSSHCILCPCMA